MVPLSFVNTASISLIPIYDAVRYAENAKQGYRVFCLSADCERRTSDMAEYMLLRLMMAGTVVGGFALVMGVATMMRKIWRHACQGKESQV